MLYMCCGHYVSCSLDPPGFVSAAALVLLSCTVPVSFIIEEGVRERDDLTVVVHVC